MYGTDEQDGHMNEHYRQGDVLLVKISELPKDAVKELASDKIVLALGEATGHSHCLTAPQGATLFAQNEERYFEIKHSSSLVHEEHSPINLDPGLYRVVRQREYTPERIRRVAD
ncbi:MAG TPA: hypothetical protein V6C72_16720 [Chroococcales cyanobacterium]